MLDDIVADDEIEAFCRQLDRLQIADDRLVRDVVAGDLARLDIDQRDPRNIEILETNIRGRPAARFVNRNRPSAEMSDQQARDFAKRSRAFGVPGYRGSTG